MASDWESLLVCHFDCQLCRIRDSGQQHVPRLEFQSRWDYNSTQLSQCLWLLKFRPESSQLEMHPTFCSDTLLHFRSRLQPVWTRLEASNFFVFPNCSPNHIWDDRADDSASAISCCHNLLRHVRWNWLRSKVRHLQKFEQCFNKVAEQPVNLKQCSLAPSYIEQPRCVGKFILFEKNTWKATLHS